MSVTIDPTVIYSELRGARVLGAITISNSGTGLVFDNDRVLDIRHMSLLSVADSKEAVMVAKRVLAREAALLGSLEPLDAPAKKCAPAADPFALEVEEWVPKSPLVDATAAERDEARQRRLVVVDAEEEGWE